MTVDKNTVSNRIQTVQDWLNTVVYEREDEIRNMLACMVSRQHMFLLGLPGIAKSYMILKFLETFDEDVSFFKKLLTPHTQLDELFGPISVSALRERDAYERKIDGYLADTYFAFLDEIWKSNSQVLNSLLTLLEERRFDNGVDEIKAPLVSVIAASNELPQDDNLAALYDRFMVRMHPRPLSSDQKFRQMINPATQQNPAPKVLDLDTVRAAQKHADSVELTDGALDALVDIRARLRHPPKQDDKIDVYVSDRRFRGMVKFLQAMAVVLGGDKVTEAYMVYLTDCMWEQPDQRGAIADILQEYLPTVVRKSNSEWLAAKVMIDRGLKSSDPNEVSEIYDSVKTELNDLESRMEREDENAPHLRDIHAAFKSAFSELKNHYMEIMF